MKSRPILFSPPMIRAILLGSKVQTRRVITPQPQPPGVLTTGDGNWRRLGKGGMTHVFDWERECSYGVVGDHLWLREGWQTGNSLDKFNATEIAAKCLKAGYKSPGAPIRYRADGEVRPWGDNDVLDFGPWGRNRLGRFMPRWASRITLEITDVRVQRLQEISEEDAIAEGIYPRLAIGDDSRAMPWTWQKDGLRYDSPRQAFQALWDSINAKTHPWDSNPWVFAISFKKIV